MLNGEEGFSVEVRRPLQSRSFAAVFKARWGKLKARWESRRTDNDLRWFDVPAVPDDLGLVVVAIGVAVLLVFAAPYLVLFLFAAFELVVLSLVACAGLFAAVVLRRRYRVVVDSEGVAVAPELPVVGLRKARETARHVEQSLAEGCDPCMAVRSVSAA
jgi:hypothetical protein